MISVTHILPSLNRRAFTMVELLIVVAILLVLTTMTIVAVDLTFQSERVRGGSRQVQSLLEGARDRAIFAGRPVGVRFLVDSDPLNARKCTSMVYVGSSDPWKEGTITLKRPDFDNDDIVDDLDGDGNPDTEIWMIDGSPETLWHNLLQRGYLGVYEYDVNGNGVLEPVEDVNGNGLRDLESPRIKIPADQNGTWYNVNTYYLGKDPLNPNRLLLVSPYRDPGTSPSSQIAAFEGTGPNSYVLDLPPRILPDAEPVLLPGGVAIDLDASSVPAAWRPPDNALVSTPYSSRMDLMFSPRGTVTGAEAAAGLIHFYVALSSDIDLSTEPAPTGTLNRLPVNNIPATDPDIGTTESNVPGVPGENQFSAENPVSDRSLVTVFTHTGKISSFPLNITDTSPADGFADDPYVFAERGEGITQ
jgi:prepilin-type N-terminal cleavage/methylation domain-containing protein